jgi:CBS domain containing-hemolysin-like protein
VSVAVSLLIILACMVLSAFFSSSETALLRLHAHQVEHDVRDAEGPEPLAVRNLLRSTSHLLVTILLGNNVVNILGVAVASALAVSFFGEQAGVLVATAVMTVLVLVFCEVLPKAVAASHARSVAHVVALPLYVIHFVLRPFHYFFDRAVDPLVRRLGAPTEPEHAQGAEQILRMARQVRSGHTEHTPLAIIGAAAGAADMTVADIMVPRTEMCAYPLEISPADLLEEMLEERYTRVPIYRKSIDEIAGVAHLKDLIKLVRTGGDNLQGILRPVLRVPERKPILRLLTDMQRAFSHLAIVKDEFSVTLGMVTQEDILEELVGEIRDEFDREELLTIRQVTDGSYRALARVSVRDFNRKTGWDLSGERGDTLGGLVFNTLGHAAAMGEVVDLPGYQVTVVDVSGSRITEVKVTKIDADEAEGDGAKASDTPAA